ncbi:hypothetical protein ASE77_01225 [Sphingomonas sp. Leaf226]|nr:hypothetical protein ASE77_01225 [Sphingomonas sp. Leaf226]
MVYQPSDQRTADETPDQGGDDPIALRVTPLGIWSSLPLFQRLPSLDLPQSLIERGKSRIFNTVGVLSGFDLRHDMLST